MDRVAFNKSLARVTEQEMAIYKRAYQVHARVNQYYDNHPYIFHLHQVFENLVEFGCDVFSDQRDILPVIFAAYFHDSIEDARLTYNDVRDIAREYMSDDQAWLAAEIVYALTNEKGRTRSDRANDSYYKGIQQTPYAPLVKACDRLANYNYAWFTKSKMAKMYKDEMDKFISHITVDTVDPRYLVPVELINALKQN